MTTKQYLSQIAKFNKMIRNKTEEIQQLRLLAYGAAANSDTERVQTSSDKDRLGSAVSKIVDEEKRIEDITKKRALIVKQIESMDDANSYDVLAKRYILGKEFKTISIENEISLRHVYEIHDEAVCDFENRYGDLYLTDQ